MRISTVASGITQLLAAVAIFVVGIFVYVFTQSNLLTFLFGFLAVMIVNFVKTKFVVDVDVEDYREYYWLSDRREGVIFDILLLILIGVSNLIPLSGQEGLLSIIRPVFSGMFVAQALTHLILKRYLFQRHIDS